MDFLELVKRSRSYRSFDPNRPIAMPQLRKLVELCRYTPSSVNLQVLRFRLCCTPEENALMLARTGWARLLKDQMQLPPPGHGPSAYVVICAAGDADKARFRADAAIAAQTLLLGAADQGLGGCMIGNFNPDDIAQALKLPAGLTPLLVVALGTPDEQIILEDATPGGSTAYYRDAQGIHHVPKRTMEELIVAP